MKKHEIRKNAYKFVGKILSNQHSIERAVKEERDQLTTRCKKMEQDLKMQWVWDSKHGYWIPSNASAATLMQKVPFPIMGIAKDDKKD